MQKTKWYALYTRPRYEKKVETLLIEKGIETYLPLVKTLRVWSDRKKWVNMPLFSSYIFVHIYLEKKQFDVLNTPGAVKFVTFEGKAASIPEKQIDDIKWVLSTDVESEPIDQRIDPGEKVEIIKGPLKGLMAEMVQYNNKSKILIRMEQLGKSIEIKVHQNQVVKKKG